MSNRNAIGVSASQSRPLAHADGVGIKHLSRIVCGKDCRRRLAQEILDAAMRAFRFCFAGLSSVSACGERQRTGRRTEPFNTIEFLLIPHDSFETFELSILPFCDQGTSDRRMTSQRNCTRRCSPGVKRLKLPCRNRTKNSRRLRRKPNAQARLFRKAGLLQSEHPPTIPDIFQLSG